MTLEQTTEERLKRVCGARFPDSARYASSLPLKYEMSSRYTVSGSWGEVPHAISVKVADFAAETR